MKSTTVSIAEGKRDFSRLVRNASEKNERIIITKRSKPLAVIVPYEEYQCSVRFEGYKKIMEAREAFSKTGLKATAVYKESREELEKKS